MTEKTRENERFFTLELTSRNNLKNVALTDGSKESVLIEGTLGELVQATFAEEIILEVIGQKGILRINLSDQEIKRKTETLEVKP